MTFSDLPQQIVFGLGLGAIYGLVAIGFSLIYRTMGLLSFVHPQFVMLGSVFGYTALVSFHLALWQAAVPVGVATALASLVVDQIGIRPIRRRGGTEIAMILATVAWGIILVEVVRQPWAYGPSALSLRSNARPPFQVLGITIRWERSACSRRCGARRRARALSKRTTAGRALRASAKLATPRADGHQHRAHARARRRDLRLPRRRRRAPHRILLLRRIATGAIGVKALAAAVIGGFGNVPGALLGGLVLGVFDSLIAADVSATWRDAIVYALIIVILLIRAGLTLRRRIFARG